ncbi:MAG: FecR domain-containing protein [Rubricoccaceae bacterium]|nr:FecR domain-containing protein [Rubricoccaceae bacterium]
MPDRPTLPPQLRDALAAEPAAEQAELERVWDLLDAAAPDAGTPSSDAWDRLSRRLATPSPEAPPLRRVTRPARPQAPDRRTARQPRPLRLVTRALAVAAALVVVGVVAWWVRPVTVTASPGAQVAVALPDGSEATLNSGTTLTYRRGFDRLPFVDADRRSVALAGEAFFAVEPGARPFVVETHNAEVTVLGTRFNVRARQGHGEDATQVAVSEGRVRVATGAGAVVLTAGESSAVPAGALAPTAPSAVPAEAVDAWRAGGFAVRNLPLPAVLAEVERRWDVRVALRGTSPPDARVTLYLAAPDGPEDVLRDLAGGRDLRYRPTSDGFEVFPAAP